MKTNKLRTALVSLVAVSVIAAGATAFAGKRMGNQSDDRGYGGYGNQSRRDNCAYGQMQADLTSEQREQLETERRAYFDATKIERQDLYAKRLELRAEMAKRQPDLEKASAVQKEVSELRASLDQKRLNHIMAMRKINPDAGRRFMMEERGMGHHWMGQGMGNGPGSCRNQ